MGNGLIYELKVLDLVKKKLNRGDLGIIPVQANVQHKPAYYSRDRRKDISFDVSIEVCRKGVDTPFLVWIWECKNYNHSVPVDDVEEFHAKLSQIGADRTKGTMITPIGFDEGTLEFARSKGIGLWRWIPEDNPICIMDDLKPVEDKDIVQGLTTPNTTRFRFQSPFYGLTCDGRLTTDCYQWIKMELLEDMQ